MASAFVGSEGCDAVGESTEDSTQFQSSSDHIFCVNGSRDFLKVLDEILTEEGYAVTTARFGSGVFAQILSLRPTVIILDLVFQMTDGWDLLEDIWRNSSTRQIPVIVTSTDNHLLDQAKTDTDRFGAHNYLLKPFDLDELLGMIQSITGRR